MAASESKISATVETEHGNIAADADELREVVDGVEAGDGFRVHYLTSNGLEVTAHAQVSEVDREFGDIRFGGNYLHVNVDTGDYYFQDDRRESPESGYQITTVTAYKVD